MTGRPLRRSNLTQEGPLKKKIQHLFFSFFYIKPDLWLAVLLVVCSPHIYASLVTTMAPNKQKKLSLLLTKGVSFSILSGEYSRSSALSGSEAIAITPVTASGAEKDGPLQKLATWHNSVHLLWRLFT